MRSLELERTAATGHPRELESERRADEGTNPMPGAQHALLVSIVVAAVNVALASQRSGGPGLVADLLLFGLCLLLFYVLDRLVGDRLSRRGGARISSFGDFDSGNLDGSECDSAVATSGSDGSGACGSNNTGGWG